MVIILISNNDLLKVLEITQRVYKEKDYKKLLKNILLQSMEISNSDGATLYLLNDNKLEFYFMVTKSKNIMNDKIDLPPVDINSKSVVAISSKTKKIINIPDVYNNLEYDLEGPKKYDKLNNYLTKSVLVIPLFDRDNNIIGSLQLINRIKDNEIVEYDDDIINIINSLANISSLLLNNMMLYDEIKGLLDSFVMAIVKAIESRTPYNAFHTMNVAKICSEFVDYLNKNNYKRISHKQKDELVLASYLHDVGKLIIPLETLNKSTRFSKLDLMLLRYDIIKLSIENKYLRNEIEKSVYENEIKFINEFKEFIIKINNQSFLSDDDIKYINDNKLKSYDTILGITLLLNDLELNEALIKKGTLTELERKEVEAHVIYTNKIIKDIKFGKNYKNVTDIASNHHEYLDGSGYPNHIKNNEISYYTRILTIVDIYESLISTDRPYKKPMPKDKALNILNIMANEEGKLDKDLVKIFIEFMGNENE